MQQAIHDFLNSNEISVLTTLLANGTPHSATLHFSHQQEPLEFYFSTKRTSVKCENLLDGKPSAASMVVGFSTENWITLQLRGVVQVITNKIEQEKVQEIHYAKHPGSKRYKDDAETVFLKFTPNWWRYSDLSITQIISSTDTAD